MGPAAACCGKCCCTISSARIGTLPTARTGRYPGPATHLQNLALKTLAQASIHRVLLSPCCCKCCCKISAQILTHVAAAVFSPKHGPHRLHIWADLCPVSVQQQAPPPGLLIGMRPCHMTTSRRYTLHVAPGEGCTATGPMTNRISSCYAVRASQGHQSNPQLFKPARALHNVLGEHSGMAACLCMLHDSSLTRAGRPVMVVLLQTDTIGCWAGFGAASSWVVELVLPVILCRV